MTREQLAALRTEPEGYASIVQYKRELAETLFEHDIRHFVGQRLGESGRLQLVDRADPGTMYVVEAKGIKGGEFIANADKDENEDEEAVAHADRRIVVTRHERSMPMLRFECDRVTLLTGQSTDTGEPWVELELEAMTVTALDGSEMQNQRDGHRLSNLALPSFAARDLARQPAAEVLEAARAALTGDEALADRTRRLAGRIERLGWDVSALLTQRYALSVTALLLVMLGSILAIWMRTHQPLTIYLCAFLPSILDLILISGGEQVMREGSLIGGGLIMWSGNAVMVLVAVVTFLRLRKH